MTSQQARHAPSVGFTNIVFDSADPDEIDTDPDLTLVLVAEGRNQLTATPLEPRLTALVRAAGLPLRSPVRRLRRLLVSVPARTQAA